MSKISSGLVLFWAICLYLPNAFAQKTKYGEITTDIQWSQNDTGQDVLAGKIVFRPNKHTPMCERLSFIQIAKVEVSPGVDYEWTKVEGHSNRNHLRVKGFFIDHDSSKCKKKGKCSPFYRDSWPNPDQSQDGESSENGRKEASLFDAPFGWERFESIKLEACAICKSENDLTPLACVQWGGTWPLIGERKIYPQVISESPTKTFIKALEKFNRFYQNQ